MNFELSGSCYFQTWALSCYLYCSPIKEAMEAINILDREWTLGCSGLFLILFMGFRGEWAGSEEDSERQEPLTTSVNAFRLSPPVQLI